MDCKKVFANIIKHHCKGEIVTFVSSYKNIKDVLKMLLAMPDTYIEDISITRPEWDGYDEAWALSFGENSDVWCSKAININGEPFRGEGYFVIDASAIDGHDPENFVLGNSHIKIINGA